MAKIHFVLPVKGGSGGAHSVVQEATAMRQLGVEARIFVNDKNFPAFRRNYSRFDWLDQGSQAFTGPKDLADKIGDSDLTVATTNTSVHSVAEALQLAKGEFRTAYYVQDYEPLFYEPNSEHWNIALASFSVLKRCTYFAKTQWLQEIVQAAHKHEVARVVPSIDGGIYHPRSRSKTSSRRLLCAMVRPPTPRRAPARTMRVLGRIAAKYSDSLDIVAFGTTSNELSAFNIPVYDGIEIVGVLSQPAVADLLQKSDFFIDLSDYQAFGRTAAEAMACGTISLAPTLGGSREFIQHAINSFLVDTSDEGIIIDVIDRMLSLTDDEIRNMRIAAIEAVQHFTPMRAAISELRAFDMIT